MRKKRSNKPYKNQYLRVLLILIIVLLVYQYILSFSPDESIKTVCNAILIPVVMAVFGFGLSRIDKSNADVDIRLHFGNKKVLSSQQPVWLIPDAKYTVSSMRFIEVENIGETMISAVGIILGKQNGKKYESYKVLYSIHKNESIYYAIPDKADISTVNIVYISYGFDEAVTFSGDVIDISGVKMFSARDRADGYIKLKVKTTHICRRASLEQMLKKYKEDEESKNC